jgi:hypothetical protein
MNRYMYIGGRGELSARWTRGLVDPETGELTFPGTRSFRFYRTSGSGQTVWGTGILAGSLKGARWDVLLDWVAGHEVDPDVGFLFLGHGREPRDGARLVEGVGVRFALRDRVAHAVAEGDLIRDAAWKIARGLFVERDHSSAFRILKKVLLAANLVDCEDAPVFVDPGHDLLWEIARSLSGREEALLYEGPGRHAVMYRIGWAGSRKVLVIDTLPDGRTAGRVHEAPTLYGSEQETWTQFADWVAALPTPEPANTEPAPAEPAPAEPVTDY